MDMESCVQRWLFLSEDTMIRRYSDMVMLMLFSLRVERIHELIGDDFPNSDLAIHLTITQAIPQGPEQSTIIG